MSEIDLSQYETKYFKILDRDEKGVYRTSGIIQTSDPSLRYAGVPYLEQFMPSMYQLHSKKPIANVYCPHCDQKMDRIVDDYNKKIIFLCINCKLGG